MSASKTQKDRLDKILVDQGLCETRSKAQSLILAGHVMVNNQVIDKPGMLCDRASSVSLKESPKYVSRGGLKLEKALVDFQVDVTQRVCMDVGASTGGFTDCLLQHGASHVHALDVGYGQLDWKLRQDPRVSVFEKTHILKVDPATFQPPPTMAVIDVSFISLKKVVAQVAQCLQITETASQNHIIALVKPQFEYRDYCDMKGFQGVVTAPADHEIILPALAQDVLAALTDWILKDVTESPIQGPKGNREFFFHLQRGDASETLPNRLSQELLEKMSQLALKNS